MIDLYGCGTTARQVAEKFGVSLRSVAAAPWARCRPEKVGGVTLHGVRQRDSMAAAPRPSRVFMGGGGVRAFHCADPPTA